MCKSDSAKVIDTVVNKDIYTFKIGHTDLSICY